MAEDRAPPHPVIAIDVDGVLAEHVPHVLERANREKGLSLCKADITEWTTLVGDEAFDKLIKRYLADSDFILSMPTIEGARESVDRIRGFVRIVIATARAPATIGDTQRWVDVNFSPELRVVPTSSIGKDDVGADLLVDDYIPNIEAFANGGRKAVLFDQPWNRRRDDLLSSSYHSQVEVAMNWQDVEAIVGRFVGAPRSKEY